MFLAWLATRPCPEVGSLDGARGALVDACAALGADVGVDDGDVTDGDGGRGARVSADSASDTLRFFDCWHLFTSVDGIYQPNI